MPEQPPAQLVELLEHLGLATAAQVARMGRRTKRLARDLPRFESVWVDALAQARILTPFQAAELNAGRGQSLRIGPYVLCQRLFHPCYVPSYQARNIDSGQIVQLAVIEPAPPQSDRILRQLESVVTLTCGAGVSPARAAGTAAPQVVAGCVKHTSKNHDNQGAFHAPYSPLSTLIYPLTHVGADGDRIFAASPWLEGQTAAQWMVHHGRFSPEVVLEIARAMLTGLMELEKLGILHGDVSTSSLILGPAGDVVLAMPGLRTILRPEEGCSHADLLPEAYDSLAPERVSAGTPPNVQSEIYACGCVWWHLLCGRSPLVGGSSLAKLRAAQAAEICDVRRYAADAPAALAGAISACLQREPSRRPESMARLAAMLGGPTRNGKEAVADCLAQTGRPAVRWTTTVRKIRKSRRTPLWMAGTACCLAMAVAILWPNWHGRSALLVAEKSEVRGQKSEGRDQRARIASQKPAAAHSSSLIPPPSSLPDTSSPVVPASYQQAEAKPQDLVLAGGKPLSAASLDLRTGQCVRGPSGKRAALLVSHSGLIIDKENVRFENIDFVWSQTAASDDANAAERALVQVRASRAEFRGCSFQCQTTGSEPAEAEAVATSAPAAIRWVHPARANEADTSLPSGRLQLTDCLLYRVQAGVDCHTAGALAIELSNTLHLDAGPLVRLDHCPLSDEPVSIALAQVTLRGGGPLLEYVAPHAGQQPGEIAVASTACAFVPQSGEPLLRLTGPEPPGRLSIAVRWTGQGSLVSPRVPIIAWRGPDGQQQTIDEASLSIAGLVRSEVGFAGAASGDPMASRLLRWQAPLQSANPPGIEPARLPMAEKMRDER